MGFVALLLTVTVAQASPAPALSAAPAPVASSSPLPPPPGWTAAPLEKNQVTHFERKESDGTVSSLYVFRQVCDCQPPDVSAMLIKAVKQYGGTATQDTTTVCGQQAVRVTVSGLANPKQGVQNFENLAFRQDGALVMMQYNFSTATPAPDAETTLRTLCPV